MNRAWSDKSIKALCGQVSFVKGDALFRARKAEITRYDPGSGTWEAEVNAPGGRFNVTVREDKDGDLHASCTCPSLGSYDRCCQHVAAAMLGIREAGGSGAFEAEAERLPEREETGMADRLLEMFGSMPKLQSSTRIVRDDRDMLAVGFTCAPVSYGYRKTAIAIEMSAGLSRPYAVPRIRDLLESIDRGEACAFSPRFAYEPKRHGFRLEDGRVIRELVRIVRHEKLYRDTAGLLPAGARGMGSEGMLLIPPVFWDALLPHLAAAPSVRIETDEGAFEGIRVSKEPLPLAFRMEPEASGDGCRIEVEGLDRITVLEPYGMALHEGRLFKLAEDDCRRLSELKDLLETTRSSRLPVPASRAEAFMEKVVPGLMKLGSVRIEQAVADRLMQVPLKAKLYLDRVKERLLAGLEFHYGELVINPLEAEIAARHGGRILIRDGEREQAILDLMEQCPFTKTEGGYYLTEEEAEYDFLYHVVPRLQKLADVYATSAVKTRLFTGHAPPRIVLEAGERTDWLDCRFEFEGFPLQEIRGLVQSLEEKRRYYRLPGGALMPLESAELQEIIRYFREVGIKSRDIMGRDVRIPLMRGLQLVEAHGPQTGIRLGKSLRRLLEDIRHPELAEEPVPESLTPVLRDYQKTGYQWFKTLARYRFGGILADDMGLGKTLQCIAFLVSVALEIREEKRPALIVAPASLLYNWQRELARFAPQMRTIVADGSRTGRERLWKSELEADVVITSYPLLLRDVKHYAARTFHTLVLDEAQTIKNYATQTARAVKAVQAGHRFALTGTPVENRLEELWSLYDAVLPGLFPDRQAFAELPRDTVARRIRPFLLRRLKSDVLSELPEKIETLHGAELLPEQKKLYLAYLAKLQKDTLKHLAKDGLQKSRIKILAGLTRLRQLCCHPALFVEGYAGSSSKFEQLLEIVEECRAAGKRVLIFSQFTEMLGIIRRELGRLGVSFFYLDGATPPRERVELCDRFNDGERELFLISLKAGGTGLNLTGADTVILYDLWWNPAVEQQAADRAHRIGQKNVVQIIRLAALGTVEEKMYAIQQRKRNLIEEVIEPKEEGPSSLSEADIRDILMLHDA